MKESDTEQVETLPVLPDKELLAMNQLMAEKECRIKVPFTFLRPDRSDKVNPEFILYTLNDYLGHVQQCIAGTRKMLPVLENRAFYAELEASDPLASALVSVVHSIDIKALGSRLITLQKNPRDVTVSDLISFVRLLFKPLVRVYYLGPSGVSRIYRSLYQCVADKLEPSDLDDLKAFTSRTIDEWYYIFNRVFPGLFPLVLRMCSQKTLTMNQLYYANGSKVLAWLGLKPSDVLIAKKDSRESDSAPQPVAPPEEEAAPAPSVPEHVLSPEVEKGLAILERLFPEAGWNRLEEMPDMCPYFQPILQFQDAFTQLSPDNPLHQTMIMFWILEELFQGLRLIKFEQLEAMSARDDIEPIDKILEDWILYQEMIFDKAFASDLKEYTHQIYTQPDYNKNPYGRKLLSNMYTLIKQMFLPWFNIQMYGTVKAQKDDRLPPFFVRVARLRRLLSRYASAIESAPPGSELNPEGSVPGVINPWAIYKFDISNPVSRRLDAICGGKHSKTRTNALLIEYTLAILEALNWWVNDKKSYAYQYPPEYLYRVVEPGSAVPAFGVTSRTDVDAIFVKSLKGPGL